MFIIADVPLLMDDLIEIISGLNGLNKDRFIAFFKKKVFLLSCSINPKWINVIILYIVPYIPPSGGF